MKQIVIILLNTGILFGFTGFKSKTQNTEWIVASSSVTFKIKNAGFTVDGSLGALKATILFDAAKYYSSSIVATLDSKTINTGNSSRDGHLKKEEYFDIEKYPTISLKASLFSKEPNGSYRGFFKLTIKKTTKDVIIPFTFVEKNDKGLFKGTFTINRLDYGVGESSMILSDNASITIEVNVIKK